MKIVKKKVGKGAGHKRIPYTIRTIKRRPTATSSSSLSTPKSVESTSSSTIGSRPGASIVVKKARPIDGRRVRLRDSLLARVQGKYRARSTTVKPIIEDGIEKETVDKPKVIRIRFYIFANTYKLDDVLYIIENFELINIWFYN